MKRRIYLIATAITAASLVVGVAVPAARTTVAKPKPVKLTCSISIATEAPAGAATVPQPASAGNQYGPIHCSKLFGGGLEADSFTVPDSGDTVGKYTQYFNAGSIHGTFDLTPQEGGPISTNSFQSQTYTGTLTVTGGTGVYKGITGKGKGTLKCVSPDSVHMNCTEKGKVTPKTALS